MRSVRLLPMAPLLLLLAACVTINVYFPAVAAERAADRIIEDVWGREAQPGQEQPPEPDGEPQSRADRPDVLRLVAVGVLDWLIAPASAQASPDIDISSPAIRNLTSSMEQRHAQLRPLYESGAVGLTADAQVTVRDLNAVPLAERNAARQLVSAENSDREALYREIARANDHPEWEPDIRDVFAERWIANARPGWYYQNAQGQWQQK